MKKTRNSVLITRLIGVLAALAFTSFNFAFAQNQPIPPCCEDRWDPWWTDRDMWGPGMMGPGMMGPGHQQRMARHMTYMHSGIPSEYLGQRSPLAMTPNVVREGGELYAKQCAECHGAQGMGDGAVAKSLNPSPALLAYMIQMPMSVDGYLLWSISEGGQQFGTDMPAFKETLSTEEIWKIVAFMRAGFPPVASIMGQ